MLSSTWGAGEFTCKLRRRPHGESLAIIRRPTGAPGAWSGQPAQPAITPKLAGTASAPCAKQPRPGNPHSTDFPLVFLRPSYLRPRHVGPVSRLVSVAHPVAACQDTRSARPEYVI